MTTPLEVDACCDCQERKVDKGVSDVWAKCESLGACSGPSYVCVPNDE